MSALVLLTALQVGIQLPGGMSAPSTPSTRPPAVFRRLAPASDTRTWFQPNDYPPQSIAAKAAGMVHFALMVGSDGKPTACRIVKSSGNEGLDGATCKALMARALFHPMVDKKGKPMTATFENVVNWRLPSKSTEEISDRTFDARAIIAPTGDVVECTMSGSGNARFGGSGNNCGPFGERGFLASVMGAQYAKARGSNVRLQLSYEGQPPAKAMKTPDFYQLLAEAEITIADDGSMGRCTSVRPLQMQGRTVDLCKIVAMAPPRFAPGTRAKRAVFVLDLSADFK